MKKLLLLVTVLIFLAIGLFKIASHKYIYPFDNTQNVIESMYEGAYRDAGFYLTQKWPIKFVLNNHDDLFDARKEYLLYLRQYFGDELADLIREDNVWAKRIDLNGDGIDEIIGTVANSGYMTKTGICIEVLMRKEITDNIKSLRNYQIKDTLPFYKKVQNWYYAQFKYKKEHNQSEQERLERIKKYGEQSYEWIALISMFSDTINIMPQKTNGFRDLRIYSNESGWLYERNLIDYDEAFKKFGDKLINVDQSGNGKNGKNKYEFINGKVIRFSDYYSLDALSTDEPDIKSERLKQLYHYFYMYNYYFDFIY